MINIYVNCNLFTILYVLYVKGVIFMDFYSLPSSTPSKDSDEINQVLSIYANRMFRIAFARLKNKADAEDVVQEVFIKYIANKDKLTSEEYKKAWLIRVTINCCNSLLRSAWFRKTTSLTDDLVTEMKETTHIYKEVMQLPEKYRTVLHLFYYEELSVKEISQVLNIKESLVKTRLHRARNRLRNRCQDMDLF